MYVTKNCKGWKTHSGICYILLRLLLKVLETPSPALAGDVQWYQKKETLSRMVHIRAISLTRHRQNGAFSWVPSARRRHGILCNKYFWVFITKITILIEAIPYLSVLSSRHYKYIPLLLYQRKATQRAVNTRPRGHKIRNIIYSMLKYIALNCLSFQEKWEHINVYPSLIDLLTDISDVYNHLQTVYTRDTLIRL